MYPGGTDDNLSVRDISKQQMALVRQLFQMIATMNHIDELFQWLANAFIQRLGIQLTQFWTNQINQEGRLTIQLRTIASHDPSLPEQIVVNSQTSAVVQRIISERRSYKPQAVETIFPAFQSTLLKRYGLNYCGACFTSKNTYLPAPETIFSAQPSLTPLTMITLFFVRQIPHPDLAPAVGITLEQAISLAENRGLLLTHAGNMYQNPLTPQTPFAAPPPNPQTPFVPPPTPNPQTPFVPPAPFTSPLQEPVFPLEQLIPHRRQDADLMLASNPFAGRATISDKKARRLHGAIDGHTNVADLCTVTGMNVKEVHIALQILLNQHHIELYGPDGRPVKTFPFLKDI